EFEDHDSANLTLSLCPVELVPATIDSAQIATIILLCEHPAPRGMRVQHQLPQIALLPVRRPQARKTSFQHQLQNVGHPAVSHSPVPAFTDSSNPIRLTASVNAPSPPCT